MQAYSDPSLKSDPYALPDLSVEYFQKGAIQQDFQDEPNEAGWYYALCSPGCLPDSDWIGPFSSAKNAIKTAQVLAAD